MKKLFCAMLAGCMCFGLAACSSDSSKEEKKEEKEEKKDVYEMKETVKLEDQNYTVNSLTTSQGTDFATPKDGNVFVLIDVTIENTSEEEISYNELNFSIQNSQGQIDSIGFSVLNVDHPLGSGKLAAGGKVSGTIVAEEPADDINGLTLIYKSGVFGGEEIKVNLKA